MQTIKVAHYFLLEKTKDKCMYIVDIILGCISYFDNLDKPEEELKNG